MNIKLEQSFSINSSGLFWWVRPTAIIQGLWPSFWHCALYSEIRNDNIYKVYYMLTHLEWLIGSCSCSCRYISL